MNRLFRFAACLVGCLLFALPFHAQDVSEGAREFMKKEKQNALSVVVIGEQKNVLEVLDQKFKLATGTKVKTKSGLKYLEGVRYPQISSERLDIYYTVEKSGKNDKNASRVILFLSKGNQIFLNSSGAPKTIQNATKMLQKLGGEVEIYEMELAIADQEKNRREGHQRARKTRQRFPGFGEQTHVIAPTNRRQQIEKSGSEKGHR